MRYRLRIDPLAQRSIEQFILYCAGYAEEFAAEQIERLNRALAFDLSESPLTWNYLPFTGAPYRGYLFRVGERTQYWIVFTVDEERHVVDVLHFWGTGRDPEIFRLG